MYLDPVPGPESDPMRQPEVDGQADGDDDYEEERRYCHLEGEFRGQFLSKRLLFCGVLKGCRWTDVTKNKRFDSCRLYSQSVKQVKCIKRPCKHHFDNRTKSDAIKIIGSIHGR